MTIYLHPGVYVEEVSMTPHPIEGVPTATAGSLVAAAVAARAPAWTDAGSHDPGVSMLEVLAYAIHPDVHRLMAPAAVLPPAGECTDHRPRRWP